MSDLVARLKAACVGHPDAKIPWPHRLLHEAADELTALRAHVAKLEADNGRLCALVEKRLENRDGYTIIDFLRVWHDQQKARANKAEARIAELERAADGARLELIENDEDSRENAIAVLRVALAGKQPQEGE